MRKTLRLMLPSLCLLLILGSCKSRKNTLASPAAQRPPAKEYRRLSERLNLEVDRGDNIALYEYVASWLGTSHKTGGCDKGGIDCSCFVRMAFDHVYHKQLPRTAADMHKQVSSVSRNRLEEGDLVFFTIKSNKPSHVGIYLKQGWFAHVSTSKGVMINNLSEAYYDQYFTGGGKK